MTIRRKKGIKKIFYALEDCIYMANNKVSDSIRCSRPIKMMFSSYGFRSPIIREKYAKVIKQDETLKKKSCMIIPFAGFNTEKTYESEKGGLIEFGFDPSMISLLDKDHIPFYVPDYIYVPGGDPFKLLSNINEYVLRSEVRLRVLTYKSVYIGVSAGAYVACPDIEYVKHLEDDNVIHEDYSALGLVQNSIVCHSDHYSYSQIKSCENVSGKEVISIRDDQLVCYRNGKIEYV